MAALLFVTPHPTRPSLTVGLTISGGIIHFAILAEIDQETRELLKSIIRESKSKLQAIYIPKASISDLGG